MFKLFNNIEPKIQTGVFVLATSAFAVPINVYGGSNDRVQVDAAVIAPTQKVNNGLTALIAVPKGIHGSFSAAGKVIHFETRRGPQTPAHLRADDPAAPLYEVDVRFLDAEGNPYLVQIGGDAPIDPSWSTARAKPKTAQAAKSDFDLAHKAVDNIKRLKFNAKFKPEQMALINLLPAVEEAQVTEAVEPSASALPQAAVPVSTYRHRVEIHHKSCCFGLGRHSATVGKYISNTGVTTTAVITCNHGTCAHQMALKCSWTSASPGNRTTRLLNYVLCSTPYNPTSVFGHNSNDDTDLQYRAVRYNVLPSTSSGMCNDSSVNNEPTHCY